MLDNLLKYLNIFLALIVVLPAAVAAVFWVPNTFLTTNKADELFKQAEDAALARDKELHTKMRKDYIETQIRLNFLILRSYSQRDAAGTLSDEDRIAWEALKLGQTDLLAERGNYLQEQPEWIQ